jgi:hypothetical protein
MKENYTPGKGCMCHAHSESECGCDVDWTPREVYELRETISDLETRHAATMLHTQSIVDEANDLREQRDRLAEALREIANEDYGGEQAIAHKALAALKGVEQ